MTDKKITGGVECTIEILDSALKHGITKETILYVLDNIVFDEMEDDSLIVFHAMTCRKNYQEKLFR
jgi:hypothetical protein